MTKIFSIRHRKALGDGTLNVGGIPERLRGRLWNELTDVDTTFRKTDVSGYNEDTKVLWEVVETLKRLYGVEDLMIYDSARSPNKTPTDLKGFVRQGDPHQVLDVVEVCWEELWTEKRVFFQKRVNDAFEEESCPWRLSDGDFFKVDSEFLEEHVLANAHALLRKDGFSGAHDEFLEARNDLTGGEPKDAIHKACKSFESVLKVVTGESGNASILTKLLKKTLLADLPEEARNAIVEQVLMSLPTMRNKLGGHGQGGEIIEVPKAYASLAVHMAAVFNAFVIEKHISMLPPPPPPKPVETPKKNFEDDDIPF